MRCIALMLLSSLLAGGALAAEKVAKPAPEGTANAEREATQRKAAAEWIRRCDKLEGDRRMQCLDEVRARIEQSFEGRQPGSKNDR